MNSAEYHIFFSTIGTPPPSKMVKREILRVKSFKKTTDLYQKPVFLLEKTLELDKEQHFDLILQKTDDLSIYKQLLKSKIFSVKKDRMSMTEQMERIFNRHLVDTLVKLCKCRNDDQKTGFIFNLIVDYIIKYCYIDRYNKTELFLLLLPNHLEYEKEIQKLGFESARNALLKMMKSKPFYSTMLKFCKSRPEFYDQLFYDFFKQNKKGLKVQFHMTSFINAKIMEFFKQTSEYLKSD
ncbi:hypothetical protein M153_950009485 [Pseudoloma neurophilia]|uniref:Uncharacterized protein n=1 Tax=Pseudoloma neurophilia TaxID=146866 RepID=A0A0R0M0Q2_9MICR|nr:hypothetical protein M153_950009485 [Pseudoloma neurophilia]